MAAYLIDHPGALRQYSARTNWRPSRPTGLTVLHTTEFAPVWTAEAQAAWIARRADPGSYHDVADSYGNDEHLVPYHLGAWQDGTGSNGMALSVAFICRTTDWGSLRPADRTAILRAGARCFARQQAWLRDNGYPTTPLRLITKAQSDAGQAGFIYHGWRDPGRRTDPGTTAAHPFPFDEFITECRAVMSGAPAPLLGDDMAVIQAPGRGAAIVAAGYFKQLTPEEYDNTSGVFGPVVHGNARQFDLWRSMALHGEVTAVRPGSVDVDALAVKLAGQLNGSSQATIAAELRTIIAEAVAAGMAADNADQADEIVDRLAQRLGNPAA